MNQPNISADVSGLLVDHRSPRQSNHASQIGHPCDRKLCYDRTHWDQAASIDQGLLGVFKTGNALEPVIGRILSEAGMAGKPKWRLIGGQVGISDKLFRLYQIAGSPDANAIQIEQDDGTWRNYAVPDIKSCSEHTFETINCFDDLNKLDFAQKWYSQLNLYAFGLGLDRCMLILVRKSNLWDIKTVEWEIDLAHVDGLLSKAKRVNRAVSDYNEMINDLGFTPEAAQAEAFPDKLNQPKVCNRCPFMQICNPVLTYDEPVTLHDDALIALLDEREQLDAARKRFEQIDADLKESLPTGPLLVVGSHSVEGTFIEKPKGSGKGYWRRTFGRTLSLDQITVQPIPVAIQAIDE